MSASPRPGEITYYEELGLDASASSEGIRDAFRGLARILHPDQQTDPQLKEIAETQMRRLNRIYAVLSDPVRRASYDESLSTARNAPIIVFSGSDGNLRKLLIRGGAFAAVCFAAFLIIWFAVDNGGPAEVRGQDSRTVTGGKSEAGEDANADQIAQLRERIRTLEAEKNSALEQLSRANSKPAESVAAAPLPAPALAAVLPMAGPASGLAGTWVYSKAPSFASSDSRTQYSPEFIEVTVTEQDGTLHGQYRSRYQILDHAVSPDVEFTFTGATNGQASYAWQGSGGARGRVNLNLKPGQQLEVNWNATELGSQQWLRTGKALLAKK